VLAGTTNSADARGEENMKFLNQAVAAGVVAVALVAPARGVSAGQTTSAAAVKVDDSTIESRITASLKKNSALAPRDIDVDSDKGVVTLTGTVRTEAERASAGRLAEVTGVSRVINNIEVNPKVDESKLDHAADKTKAGLDKAVDATAKAAGKTKEGVKKGVGKTEEGVGKAAEKTGNAVGKAGDKMSDASITTGVKTGLTGEALLKDSAIDVDTNDHVVTLKGTVASEAAKTRAAAIASDTKGVTRVVNQLLVK
jgi:hyperosmotically inducible protein